MIAALIAVSLTAGAQPGFTKKSVCLAQLDALELRWLAPDADPSLTELQDVTVRRFVRTVFGEETGKSRTRLLRRMSALVPTAPEQKPEARPTAPEQIPEARPTAPKQIPAARLDILADTLVFTLAKLTEARRVRSSALARQRETQALRTLASAHLTLAALDDPPNTRDLINQLEARFNRRVRLGLVAHDLLGTSGLKTPFRVLELIKNGATSIAPVCQTLLAR